VNEPAPDTVTILVPGEAKSERKRQRFLKGKGLVGKRTDEPDRADWKAIVRLLASRSIRQPLEGPVLVSIVVRKPKPPSWPKKACSTNPWPWAWWRKPDAENLAKPVLDALTGVAWQDDAQIVDLQVRKQFGNRAETLIVIAPMEETSAVGVALRVQAEAAHEHAKER